MSQGDPPLPKRDFLLYAATASVGVIAGILAPGRRAMAQDPATEGMTVDLSDLAPGAEVTVSFQGKPVIIRHRTAAEIAAAEAAAPETLPDPLARNENLAPDAPASDQNRRATPDGRIYVSSRNCTHMGCPVRGEASGDFGGYLCPCHGAHFDTAGRVRKGPPPRNLPIPRFDWSEPGLLTLLPGPRA